MPSKLDAVTRQRLINEDFVMTASLPPGVHLNFPRNTYYTPTGKKILVIPQLREYVRKDKDGQVIESGTRDANLDNGWLLQPPRPDELKVGCSACGKWHDTKAQVAKCIKATKAKAEAWELRAQKLLKKESSNKELDSLKAELAELKQMIKDLRGGNGHR